MKPKNFFLFIGLWVALISLMSIQGWTQTIYPPVEGTQTKSRTPAPIITYAFAADKGNYGSIWRIYIEAEDPDGDMLRIASVVDQVGYGHYPTSWIYLKPQYRKHFRGYIQWNTFSTNTGYLKEWTQITLKVSVLDKAGNESNVIVFPFTFESGVKDPSQYRPHPPFDQGVVAKLGNVHIDLFEPTFMGGNGPDGHRAD